MGSILGPLIFGNSQIYLLRSLPCLASNLGDLHDILPCTEASSLLLELRARPKGFNMGVLECEEHVLISKSMHLGILDLPWGPKSINHQKSSAVTANCVGNSEALNPPHVNTPTPTLNCKRCRHPGPTCIVRSFGVFNIRGKAL